MFLVKDLTNSPILFFKSTYEAMPVAHTLHLMVFLTRPSSFLMHLPHRDLLRKREPLTLLSLSVSSVLWAATYWQKTKIREEA